MEWITQKQADDFLRKSNNKIKVIYYVQKDCPVCDDFIPDVIEVLLEKYKDHFEAYKIDSEDPDILYPPQSFPTGFFYVPNTKEKMPLLRFGGATPEYVEDDFLAMIEIKDQGKTIEQAFFVDRRPYMFPYGQKKINPMDARPAAASLEAFARETEARKNQVDAHVSSDWTKKL